MIKKRVIGMSTQQKLVMLVLCVTVISQYVRAGGQMPNLATIAQQAKDKARLVGYYAYSAGVNIVNQQILQPIVEIGHVRQGLQHKTSEAISSMVQPVSNTVLDRMDKSADSIVTHIGTLGQTLTNQLATQTEAISEKLVVNVDKRMNHLVHQSLEKVQGVTDNLVKSVDVRVDRLMKDTVKQVNGVTNNLIENVNARVAGMLDKTITSIDTMQKEVISNVDQKAIRLLADIDQMRANTVLQIDEKLNKTIKNGLLLTGGVIVTGIAAWYLFKFAHTQADRHYGKPKLFTYTSEKSIYQRLKELIHKPLVELPVIISTPKKEQLLNGMIESTKIINAKIKAGNPHLRYSNLLLWGPPGTGKTMFAQKLAKASGMEFRMMSGADVSKLEVNDALVALDEVFSFAKRNKNGLVLFIDEADSFLRDRTKLDNEKRKLVDKFLSETGSASNRIMLVFATNHEDVFDEAVKDRITDSIKMDLPSHAEREGILRLYRDKHLMDPEYNSAEFIISVSTYLNDDKIKQIASQLEGLSGRNLENVIFGLRNAADLTPSGTLTPEIIAAVVKRALVKHIQFCDKTSKPQPKLPLPLNPAAQELLNI